MKILLTCKKLTVAVLCASTAVAAFAGGGKEIIKGGQSLFHAARNTRGVTQRFVFSRPTTNKIQRAIASGVLDRIPTQAAEQLPVVNYTHGQFLQHEFKDSRLLVADQPIEKEILVKMRDENLFYKPEIDAARTIRNNILNITVLSEEGISSLAQDIQTNIKSHYLRQTLLNNLKELNIYAMALDLTDYFCLDKSFEEAAFDYTVRHPHQMNLNLRRLMYNPLVDQEVKTRLKHFLNANSLNTLEEYGAFRAVIKEAHNQYQSRLSAAKFSEIIQLQTVYYEAFAMRLDEFIRHNGGYLPKWNTRDKLEQELWEEYQWIMQHDEINNYNPLISYRKQIQVIWDSAQQPPVLSKADTLALFARFVKQTERDYPEILHSDAFSKKGFVPFEDEELLWDSLQYWRQKDESGMFQEIMRIRNQHLH